MANFKVIFRADSDGAERRTGWEPGCPVLIKAIQVARDTQTGDAYLQMKVWNLTDQIVGSFTLQAEVTYQDGTSETVEMNPLDADIAPRHDYKPLPVHLANGSIADVSARVLAATYRNASWHSEQPATPLPQGAPLNLEQGLLVERRELLVSLGKPADKYATSVLCEGAWWICPCGTPNVDRTHCLACGMPLDTLEKLEDEDFLRGKVRERKKRRVLRIVGILLLAIALLASIATIANLFNPDDPVDYQAAVSNQERGNYKLAYDQFVELEEYRDSADRAKECARLAAERAIFIGDYADAESWYGKAGESELQQEAAAMID